MFHPQYWTTRVPKSSFEQTLYEADQVFYATFPEARAAAYNAALKQNIYHPGFTDYSTLHEDAQPLEYNIGNEQKPNINSTSVPSGGTTQKLLYPPLSFDYSEGIHPQQSFPYRHQNQTSYYPPPPPPIENEVPVYMPSFSPYNHQHSSKPSLYISLPPPSPGPASERTFLVNQPSDPRGSPHVNTDIQESITDGHPKKLNRHMKPPTLKLTNDCQLAVMRLSGPSEPNQLDSLKHDDQSFASSSNSSDVMSYQTTTPTEFLLNSPKSPSIGLSSLPSENLPERKPPLACLFCRGRKIACGPPLPGSLKKTCNQCRKRSLQCRYPTESRRGLRKKKPPNGDASPSRTTKTKSGK